MKRNVTAGWGPMMLLAALLIALAVAVAIMPRPAGASAALTPAQQAAPGPQYVTRTLTTVSPAHGSGESTLEWMKASGDWVAYAIGSLGCGHCGTQITSVSVQNVISNTKVRFRGSYWSYIYSASGSPVGITSLAFSAPYLVWKQPGKTVPGDGYQYAKGDYDCVVCWLNVDTGQSGAVAGLDTMAADPAAGVRVLDVSSKGRVLALSTASSSLWTSDIGTGDFKQLTVTVNPQQVKRAFLRPSNGVVWLEGDRVLKYDEGSKQTRQIGSGADGLTGDGYYIYWRTGDGLRTEDNTATGKLIVPGISAIFDTETTTPLGDIVAWAEPSGQKTLVHYPGLNAAGLPAMFTKELSTSVNSISLTSDKLAYIETEWNASPGGLPNYNVQLVWLLRPDEAFAKVWKQADEPVASGKVGRSWLWGPQPNGLALEAYAEGQGGRRLVQYYDKSRMEVNNSNGNRSDPYFVTNGLLVTEMIAGEIQTGNATFIKVENPATIPVAGDPRKDNPLTPGYAALAGVSSLHGENKAQSRVGQRVDQHIDMNGVVTAETQRASLSSYAAFAPQTGHNIPDLFWRYLQGMQGTYGFDWTFVLGYPISEAYWTQMRVSGKDMPVLVQAYQRRVLTYVPDFPAEWRVQMGNVGQHYYEWRYVLNRLPSP